MTGGEGLPRTIRSGRRSLRVGAVQELWRVDDEWWRPRPVRRVYMRVTLDDGRLLTLYHDLVEDTWWLQRC